MIEAKILCDSINTAGDRITTFLLIYPRFILAELNTHRIFSRNSASSRAIPVEKMIQRVINNTATPIYWGKNQKGMQANEELSDFDKGLSEGIWLAAMINAVKKAKKLVNIGVHKQIANRLLEPFMHITTIVTATEFGNFFNLRAHKDAQPEFQELAFQMLVLYKDNKPVLKEPGQWHLPFADKYVDDGLTETQLLKIVAARAARLSYLNFEGDVAHHKDYDLHDNLSGSGHWSPFEHPAQALDKSDRWGNFIGWKPYRKFFAQENKTEFDAEELLKNRGVK